ncbi:MAG: hypothetical protein ACRD3O_14635, partial [Terriglobia bacterium]
MMVEETVRQTLAELQVADEEGVRSVFAQVRSAMEEERQRVLREGARDEAERQMIAKNLRDRWLARN